MQKLLISFILILGLFILSCNNQTKENKVSTNIEKDSIEITKLCDLAYEYEFSNLDSAIIIYNQAIQKAHIIKHPILSAKCYVNKGIANYSKGEFDSSLYCYKNALQIYYKINNQEGIGKTWNNIGNLYLAYAKDYEKAANCFLISISEFEKLGNKNKLAWAYANYASLLNSINNYQLSIKYYQKSFDYSLQVKDTNRIAYTLKDLSSLYLVTGDTAKSNSCILQAYEFSKHISDYYLNGHIYQALSSMSAYKDGTAKALEYAKIMFDNMQKTNSARDIIGAYNYLGMRYYFNKNYADALVTLKTALDYSSQFNLLDEKRQAYFWMAESYKKMNDFKNAMTYKDKFIDLQDSIKSAEKINKINELEVKYQNAKKEADLIKKDLELSEQKAKIRNQNWIIASISIGIILLVLILFLINRNFKNKQLLFKIELENTLKEHELKYLKAGVDGEEKERTRLARELHDGLCGVLSGIKLNMSALLNDVPFIKNNNLFDTSYKMLDETIKDVRKISHDLMPTILYEEGLNEAIKYFCKSINVSKKLNVQYEVFGDIKRLNPTLELTLYRITQELLQNTIKHAEATNVYVQLSFDANNVLLTVEDNGKGFVYDKQKLNNGIGLGNLISRIEYLNGTVDIDTALGKGTSINLTINLQQKIAA